MGIFHAFCVRVYNLLLATRYYSATPVEEGIIKIVMRYKHLYLYALSTLLIIDLKPAIPSQFANGQAHYMCMRCVEKKQAREKDKKVISKPEVCGVVNNNNSKSSNSVRKRRSFPYDVRILTKITQLKKY